MNRSDAITEPGLDNLVRRFYAKVRRDPEIGPVFNAAIADWDEHLEKLTGFWCTVMLASRRYKGSPMAVHFPLGITPPMFARWLALWKETTAELFAPPLAAQLQARAERIGQNMQFSLFGRAETGPVTGAEDGVDSQPIQSGVAASSPTSGDAPSRDHNPFGVAPHRFTQVFDQTTLPAGLQKEHRTAEGLWGLIRILEGQLRYEILDPPSEVVLDPQRPGIILPTQPHRVVLAGAVKMQVEFYNVPPSSGGS